MLNVTFERKVERRPIGWFFLSIIEMIDRIERLTYLIACVVLILWVLYRYDLFLL